MARGAHPHEVRLSPNLPPFTRGDLAAVLVAVVGTIIAIVLAATGPSVQSTAGAAQILIAIAVSLINMAHIVGLLLFESVDYHGAAQSSFARSPSSQLRLPSSPTCCSPCSADRMPGPAQRYRQLT